MRCFVALPLPDDLANALMALARELEGGHSPPSVRWVKRASLHVTMRFLGELEPGQVSAMIRDVERAAAASTPLTVTTASVSAFPSPARARALVQLLDPTEGLLQLAHQLELAAVAAGCAPEQRSFKPHVTLARCKGLVDARPWTRESMQRSRGLRSVLTEVTVFRSELLPGGPRYLPLYVAGIGRTS